MKITAVTQRKSALLLPGSASAVKAKYFCTAVSRYVLSMLRQFARVPQLQVLDAAGGCTALLLCCRSRNRAGFLQQRRPLHGWVTNAPPPPARVRAFTAEWSAQFEEGESGIQGRASLPNRLCVVDLQLPAVELINGSPFSPGPPAVRPGRAAGARAEAVQGHAEPGGSSPGVPGHQQGSAGERGRPGRGGPDGEHLHNKQSPGSGPGGLGGHQPKRTSRPARGTLTGFKNKLGDPKSSVGNKLRVYQP
ncbi:collagen alpha-1(I) chain-like [Pleurodeles waltl]|uniref:collagen alpha-1(I) chain-like n=1 Tax=Pleurodeles waltl TaxID=8319 RepID=UPI0037097A66